MSYLVRTDFTDDERWSALCAAIETGSEDDPIDEPFLEYVPDPGLQGADLHAVQGAFPDPGETGVLYVADAVSCGESFGLVWAIDLLDEPGRSFLIPAAEVHNLDVNLLIANMEFADWADAVDQDGVFRGW